MQDANGARRTVFMAEERIVGYPDHYVQSTERHPMDHLSALIRDRGWGAKRLGVELDNYYFSAAAYLALQKGLPDARLIDATALVNWQRAVKSAQEIAYMRRGARIVEKIHDRILKVAAPGRRKNEIAAEIFHAGIWGAEEDGIAFGGDYPAIVPLMPSGADASAPHLTWDDRPLEAGTGVFFEVAGCHRRYHAPLCRSLYLGKPPQYLRDAEQALIEGLESGLEAARPGKRAADVARALYGALERAGIKREGRCGYPIGLSYPPDWGERTVSFRTTDETELEAGMTFHFMPGLWMDDWGLEITESILIREEGPAECLASYPRKLFTLD
jgi:ectoine hydrolase